MPKQPKPSTPLERKPQWPADGVEIKQPQGLPHNPLAPPLAPPKEPH